ncbi:PREDICTED: integral membrane protein 2C [Ceratosolen solmsi marchali]|uniref:Integral membrane protein 2 n=1 Tax=Ceratosolen solmsi marchali TaxID=326594 RepID=A0AAJ6YC38_9HYME|nr:PREDICTED: integral membrane protein 2C [Ceratosolen solmsi marchali]
MTVVTKVINEKRKNLENVEQPLVVGIEDQTDQACIDLEVQHHKNEFFIRKRYLILNNKTFRSSIRTTLCLFMTAITVMSIGVFAGVCIYKLHARDQMQLFCTGWYSIPYDISNKLQYSIDEIHQNHLLSTDLVSTLPKNNGQQKITLKDSMTTTKNYFMEHFEIDLENENYEKIDVPDFHGGRQGRFIHDFSMNKTGIVDIDGQCCFVMPLNRQRVLAPHNMHDLLKKMYNGYYEVNTEVVRESMRVIVPEIDNLSTVGTYIAHECYNMPIYLLQPVNEIIYKRSSSDGIYGQFAGKNIIVFDVLNLDSVMYMKK